MRDEPIGVWLDELGSSASTPGGGAVAALEVALGAALVEMVCNLTVGRPAYAEHEQEIIAARDRARALGAEALTLVDEDAAAFGAVISAYRLPRGDEAETARREEQVQHALGRASDVPRRTARLASEVVALAGSIVPIANPNVVSDAAAGAAAARAALAAARVFIEINSSSIRDEAVRAELAEAAAEIGPELDRADEVVASVRGRLA